MTKQLIVAFGLMAWLVASPVSVSAGPLRWIALGAVAADVTSTVYVLHVCPNCREANPLGAPLASAGAMGSWITVRAFEATHPRLTRGLYWLMLGVHVPATIHNLRVGR